MSTVMPSQVVQTIDELFPHAAKNVRLAELSAGHSSQLLEILNLLKDVPDDLITLTSADYSELILAKSTIEEHIAHWRARGNVGNMAHVKGVDAVTVIRRALSKCPDEYPPSTTTELLFIMHAALRENIRRDLGAADRALSASSDPGATFAAGIPARLLQLLCSADVTDRAPIARAHSSRLPSCGAGLGGCLSYAGKSCQFTRISLSKTLAEYISVCDVFLRWRAANSNKLRGKAELRDSKGC